MPKDLKIFYIKVTIVVLVFLGLWTFLVLLSIFKICNLL